ncbi:MAG: hypothetical protein CL424_14175 [Acidimicrobiaceae bacterium]|nr:hypothetical protein [Acidimicrobiaceae bacterium]
MPEGGIRRYVSDLAATWPVDEPTSLQRDATLVIADVCGFTRLSERLAVQGAEGSEAVKDIINAVLEPCIDAVLRVGGDVIKFAGDGFLAMFDGDDHPARAARSIAAMLERVERLATFDTPVGRVRARVSIGAESGDVDALVLGGAAQTRRDVVVSGSVVDGAYELEAHASAGQALVGPCLSGRLERTWTRRLPGRSVRRLNVSAVPRLPMSRSLRSGAAERTRQFLDPTVAALAERDSKLAEHRTVTVAFVVIDADDMRRHHAGARLTTDLADITASVTAACDVHDVCWLESDAEQGNVRLVLTVGAPTRRENDTERLAAAVHDISERHGVRVGIARGRAFVGDIGHESRRVYNVMGSVVNTAARLAVAAEPKTTLVTNDVAVLVAPSFETLRCDPVHLKGFPEPVRVARLGAPSKRTPGPGATTQLHGRVELVDQLLEATVRVGDGSGTAIELVGEGGSGKSRLVEEIIATSTQPSYLAEGRRDRSSTPYGAIADMLRATLGIPPEADPEAAGRRLLALLRQGAEHLEPVAPLVASSILATVPDTDASETIDPYFRGARTREVVVELLGVVCRTPTTFVAESVHWFDDASRLLLTAIGSAATERPWFVLATRRPSGNNLDGFDQIALRPLDDDAVRATVLETIGGAALSRRELSNIITAAGGNPLFARELARVAVAGGGPLVPDRVEELIASRIDDLDLDSRSMLRDLSVAGINADGATVDLLLREHNADDEVLTSLRDFVAVTGSGVRFRHDLYRLTAYEGLTVKRRRVLHRRFARAALERDDAPRHAATIADHAHAGLDRDVAWTWGWIAARDALDDGATHEAALHLEHALEAGVALGVDPSDAAAASELLGDACDLSGQPDAAHVAYRRARGFLSEDPVGRARIFRKHARVDERAGRYRGALAWSTKGLKLLDDAGEEAIAVAAELRLVAGVVRFFQGRFTDSIDLATAAAASAEHVGAIATLGQAHLQLEMTYSELGCRDERAHHGLRALELLQRADDRLGLANLHLNLGVSRYNEADWSTALEHYDRSADYYRQIGDTIGAEAARNNQAEILTDQGVIDEAAAMLESVERTLRAARYQLGIAITTSGRARLALRRGELEVAGELLTLARSSFVELDARHFVVDTDVRRVEHLVWSEQGDEAERLADQVAHDLVEYGSVAVLPATLARLRGWAAMLRHDQERAWDCFEEALELSSAESFDYEVALALDALVETRHGRANDDARRRDQLLRQLGVIVTPRPPWFVASSSEQQ